MSILPMKSASSTEGPPIPAAAEKYFVWMALFVTAMTYVATVRFDFVYDDDPQIVHNPFLRAWHYVPQYFVSSLWKQMAPFSPGNYYRPAFLAMARMCYAVFADHAFGWHLVALAMHLTVTWLTYVLVRRMTGQFTTAWLAALIFGVHPVHHEVVAWVSATTESLFAILFLLSFLAYLQSRDESRGFWMGISCALYALAVLSKETAIVLPALVFVHGWIEYDEAATGSSSKVASRFRGAVWPAAAYLPITFVYLVVRHAVLSGVGHRVAGVSVVTWLLTLPSILLFYAKNWFLPVRLSEFYDVGYQPSLNFMHVLLPAVILIGLGVAVWLVRNRLGAKSVGHAAAWILVPLLPALDTFVFRPDELVHDRYFYVPSIGAALLIALLIERATTSRRTLFGQPLHVAVAALGLAIVLSFFAGQAARPWSGNYALFSRAHEVAPLNSTALNDLAAEMLSRRDLGSAQRLLEAGSAIDHSDFHFPLNLARLHYHEGDFQKAESFAQQARGLNPTNAETYVILGQIQLRQNRAKEAQDSLHRAVELNPYSAPFHTSYGILLALNGDCATADQQFEAALALNPGDGLTMMQLIRCKALLGSAAASATKPGQP
jgi:tetratricopeptide (TPR) repeat protein